MADTIVFDALVEKLPHELQDRFRALTIQLRNLRADDELVLAIEALGFTSIALHQVPAEGAAVVESMPAGMSDAQRVALQEDISAIVAKAIDTPSYEDLRETVGMMQTHQRKVHQEVAGITRQLGRSRRNMRRQASMAPAMAIGLASGLTSGLIALGLMASIITKRESTPAKTLDSLPPVEQGLVDYQEADLPEFGGKVGLVFVGGEVLTAFKDDDRGVVVINPLTETP